MKPSEMKVDTPYRVINGTPDGTICNGDIIWVSDDRTLCIPDQSTGGGCLNSDEYQDLDFEVEEATDYHIKHDGVSTLLIHHNSAKVPTFYTCSRCGHETIVYEGETLPYRCPNCGHIYDIQK